MFFLRVRIVEVKLFVLKIKTDVRCYFKRVCVVWHTYKCSSAAGEW
mgnify:CR=1 FL=1